MFVGQRNNYFPSPTELGRTSSHTFFQTLLLLNGKMTNVLSWNYDRLDHGWGVDLRWLQEWILKQISVQNVYFSKVLESDVWLNQNHFFSFLLSWPFLNVRTSTWCMIVMITLRLTGNLWVFFPLFLPLELCEIKVQNMTSTFTHHRGRRDKVKQIGSVGLCWVTLHVTIYHFL